MAKRRGSSISKNAILLIGGVCVGAAGIGFYFVYQAAMEVRKNNPHATEAEVSGNDNELDPAARERVQGAAVLLRITQGGQETAASGFFCSNGLIMTDIDVLGDVSDARNYMGSIKAVLFSGMAGKEQVVPAQLAVADPYSRLAFLRLDGAKGLPAALSMGSTQFAREGAAIFVAGFPSSPKPGVNPELSVTTGTVAHVSLRHSGTPVLEIEAGLEPESSGAVVVDHTGAVLGLLPDHRKATPKADLVPLEDMRFSMNGYVADLSLKTKANSGDSYTFDINATVIDPLERAQTVTFYYWTAEEGGNNKSSKSPVTLTRVAGTGAWKGNVADLVLKPRTEFWSQTGFTGLSGAESLAQEFNRAAELGVPGAKQPVVADLPPPLPQASPTAYRPPPPPAYVPPPPPPPPDSPGWTFGYKADESTGQKTGSYEQSNSSDAQKSVRPVITQRR